MKHQRLIALLIGIQCFVVINLNAQTIPDNIAFGEPSRGGLGGKIIRVTNLESEGKGSFREALETKGKRIVVFEVGGVIDLKQSVLRITEPFLTIAGQTAPSPGITLIRGGFSVSTHDIIMKHICVRPGDAGQAKKSGWEPDGMSTSGGDAYNIIIDHCSFTWAVDENLSASGRRTEGPDSTSHRITFSNNIIAEGLSNSSHTKGPHSKGSLIHDFCRDIAIVGNLYAHNVQRNPYFKAFTEGVVANNLIYNPGGVAIQMSFVPNEWTGAKYQPKNGKISVVGNILHKGIDSREHIALVGNKGDAFMEDNLAFEKNGKPAKLTSGEIVILTEKPSWPSNFNALPSSKVEDYIVANAGARPKDRDPIDQRIIDDFLNRRGKIIDSQEEIGGYPLYEKTYRKLDIPDKNIGKWLADMAAELE
jgi:pectate lyase